MSFQILVVYIHYNSKKNSKVCTLGNWDKKKHGSKSSPISIHNYDAKPSINPQP